VKLYLGSAKPPFHPQHLSILGDPETWTWVDLYIDHPKIKKWDATDLPVSNNSIEKIYASHLLEHLPQNQIVPVLKHWRDKLQKNGQLIINVPDLVWASEQLVKYSKNIKLEGYYQKFDGSHGLMNIFFGNQDHTGEFHKSGFIKSALEEYLKKSGFKNIIVSQEFEAHEMICLLASATK